MIGPERCFWASIPAWRCAVRGLLAVTLSLVAAAGYGQENEAENLFRSMERKVRAAKSLKMVCELKGTLAKGGEQIRVIANQQFAGANKARFELRLETD